MARKSEYSFKLCQEVCKRVSEGETIKDVLASKKEYPDFTTWCKWKRENIELENLYYSIPKMKRFKKKAENRGRYDVNGKFNRSLYEKTRRKEDEIYRLRQNISTSIRDSINKNKDAKCRGRKVSDILGCSIADFVCHIESKFKDGMSWGNRHKWHLDHVIPISYATSTEEVYTLNHYSNFQPLWASKNMLKGNKHIG